MEATRPQSTIVPEHHLAPEDRSSWTSLVHLSDEARTWKHILTKPYGYPGDYAVLELVYDGAAHPDTRAPWAAQVDVWGIRSELPRAVAARKNALRYWMETQLDRPSAAKVTLPLRRQWGGAARCGSSPRI
jgi:hypothetical protein